MTASLSRPRVSVVIPVFDDQPGIDACLAALAKQTWPTNRLDVVVVDNGSATPARIDPNLGLRASVAVCSKPGSYAARNAGIDLAEGQVLAFTDADCLPQPDWIEAGIAAISAGGDPRIVGGDVILTRSARPSAVELYQLITGFDQRGNIEERGFSVTANLFASAATFRAVGKFDESLLSGGDLEWCQRAVRDGYRLVFSANTVVSTAPRTSFWQAARQARRVAGGRATMASESSQGRAARARPKRGAIESIGWIMRHSSLGPWDRFRVLCVASLLFAIRMGENLRLAFGYTPERR